MPLGVDYAQQDCSLARALELVGERWTLLILRDCFLGLRRFSDFAAHLEISKAVLTQRLTDLVEAGLLERVPRGGRTDYQLTESGRSLWPALYALTQWGEQHTAPEAGPRQIVSHTACGTDLDAAGVCPVCGLAPPPEDLTTRRGPGARPGRRTDPVSVALREPRHLLEPLQR
jgi:DNA-binding HxlR family transcriptional regulator